MSLGIIIMYIVGGALRYSLMRSPLAIAIRNRVEISTPLNSWIRVNEGVFLHNQGIPVYSGGVYHGTPFELLFSGFVIRSWGENLPFIFIAFDLLTAALLTKLALSYSKILLQDQKCNLKKYSSEASSFLLQTGALNLGVGYVTAAYLFCPYTIASCVGQTMTVIANLFLAAALVCLVEDQATIFGAMVAISTYQSFYPVCLLVPGVLQFGKNSKSKAVKSLLSFIFTLVVLLVLSSEIAGGWDFLEATYGFILTAPDLTPNIGLFWYFFTEMFEHFRQFFLATFQINAFVYVLPLSIKLRHDPVLLAMALLALTVVFRSYPSLGDVGFYMALLPMWKHLYCYLRQTFLVGCMLVSTSVLGPIMYNLWIFNGSANANFYFAVTLAFNTAQIFLVTDLLFAHVKRQYHLYHGSKLEVDGQPATLALE